jgi:protein TonB
VRQTSPLHRLAALGASCVIHVAVIAAIVAVGLNVSSSRAVSVLIAELVPVEPQAPPPPKRPDPPPTPPKLHKPRLLTLPKPVATPPPVETPAKSDLPPKVETPAPIETPKSEAVLSAPAAPAAPAAAVGEPRGPSTTFASTSDFGTGPEMPVRTTGPAAAATPSPGTTAMAIPNGITQTAIPRGGYQVRPSYPGTARRLGIQGTTTLRIFVSADGRVSDVVVEQSAGHPDLDHAAADAVKRWRFEPARRGAEAVGMWVLLPVEFRLR